MIPYKDDNPTHHIPYITYALIIANILAWLLIQGAGSEPALSQSVCNFGAIPGELLGGNRNLFYSDSLVCPAVPQSWITAFTSMFMHGGWMHLIGNMWFLWIFADNIEDALRPVKFIVFYFIGGLAAVATQIIADPQSMLPMVGASGAIGGIMGAYARLYPKVKVHIAIILGYFIISRTIPALWMLGIWLGFQVISAWVNLQFGTLGGVAFWAHIGGFVAGFLLIKLFTSKHVLAREI